MLSCLKRRAIDAQLPEDMLHWGLKTCCYKALHAAMRPSDKMLWGLKRREHTSSCAALHAPDVKCTSLMTMSIIYLMQLSAWMPSHTCVLCLKLQVACRYACMAYTCSIGGPVAQEVPVPYQMTFCYEGFKACCYEAFRRALKTCCYEALRHAAMRPDEVPIYSVPHQAPHHRECVRQLLTHFWRFFFL